MQNITYLLGAGASFHSVPIVGKIAEEMEYLSSQIKGYYFPKNEEYRKKIHEVLTVGQKACLERFIEGLLALSNESNYHFTIDTYAKKLYLQGDDDKLKELKITLSFFIYLMQYDERLKLKLDKRYIAFLASILQRNGNKRFRLPENIKFITWNYDVQLALAYKSFLNDEPIDEIHNYHLFTYPNNGNIEKRNFKIATMVHLNGMSGYYEVKTSNKIQIKNNYYKLFDSRDIFHLIENNLDFLEKAYNNEIDLNFILKFAWEHNDDKEITPLRVAQEIIKNTDILVVIGYSFPFFNRDIDKQILSFLNSNAKVYYQVPNPDISIVADRFNLSASNIIPVGNIDNFFLPPEL